MSGSLFARRSLPRSQLGNFVNRDEFHLLLIACSNRLCVKFQLTADLAPGRIAAEKLMHVRITSEFIVRVLDWQTLTGDNARQSRPCTFTARPFVSPLSN